MDKRRSRGLVVLFALLAWASYAAVACGTSTKKALDQGTQDSGVAAHAPDTGGGGGGGMMLGGDAGISSTLAVTPFSATLNVTAPGVTEQFTATLEGSPVVASWTIDSAGAGTINGNGLFTASGTLGGTINVTATANGMTASTPLNLVLQLTENPGNLSMVDIALLGAGGTGDPGFAWLYPYNQTVFPRDLPPPTLQFAGGADGGSPAFDGALVQVSFPGLSYAGFYGPGALPSQIALSQTAWSAITLSANGSNAVKVQVTKIAGGVVTGPITETWTVATGSLRGSIFYNSYNSALAGNTGAVLKLRPSEQQLSVVVSTNSGTTCHVCHVVSANGSMLEAANEPTSGGGTDGVWSLTADGGTLTPLYQAPDRTWDFGAFTPDGTKFLRYGAVPWTGGAWAPDVRGLGNGSTDVPSDLFDPTTGLSLGPIGLDAGPGGAPLNMMMPAFSPDGTMVAFNHYDTGMGHTIAVMNFDEATNTFSGLRDVATLPANLYAGWPTFTPDDQFIFFAAGTDDEYDTMSDSPPNPPEPTSNIYIAHVPTATMATADMLNGVINGMTYLPFPDDPDLNFEPTILPVASGGYYWVVFTTRRNYGNTINGSPYVGAGGAPSPRKKLWVSAISIPQPPSPENPTPIVATDLTHPPFYLDGQELTPGNMRAFWALDPCAQNGTSCQTGDQCCTGFCRQTTNDAGVSFSCVPQPAGCSQANEKCTTAADCCGASQGYQCINGFCAQPSPQ